MEYINGFLITLITMSLFVVIVLNITVLELEVILLFYLN